MTRRGFFGVLGGLAALLGFGAAAKAAPKEMRVRFTRHEYAWRDGALTMNEVRALRGRSPFVRLVDDPLLPGKGLVPLPLKTEG